MMPLSVSTGRTMFSFGSSRISIPQEIIDVVYSADRYHEAWIFPGIALLANVVDRAVRKWIDPEIRRVRVNRDVADERIRFQLRLIGGPERLRSQQIDRDDRELIGLRRRDLARHRIDARRDRAVESKRDAGLAEKRRGHVKPREARNNDGRFEAIYSSLRLKRISHWCSSLILFWQRSRNHEATDDNIEYYRLEPSVRSIEDREPGIATDLEVARIFFAVGDERDGVDHALADIDLIVDVLVEDRPVELRRDRREQDEPVAHALGDGRKPDGLEAVDAVLIVVERVDRVVRSVDHGVRDVEIDVDLHPID